MVFLTSIFIVLLVFAEEGCNDFDLTIYSSGALVKCVSYLPLTKIQKTNVEIVNLPIEPNDFAEIYFDDEITDKGIDSCNILGFSISSDINTYIVDNNIGDIYGISKSVLKSLYNKSVVLEMDNGKIYEGILKICEGEIICLERYDLNEKKELEQSITLIHPSRSPVSVRIIKNNNKELDESLLIKNPFAAKSLKDDFVKKKRYFTHPSSTPIEVVYYTDNNNSEIVTSEKLSSSLPLLSSCRLVSQYFVNGISWSPLHTIRLNRNITRASWQVAAVVKTSFPIKNNRNVQVNKNVYVDEEKKVIFQNDLLPGLYFS
jgi:hypothetical protein